MFYQDSFLAHRWPWKTFLPKRQKMNKRKFCSENDEDPYKKSHSYPWTLHCHQNEISFPFSLSHISSTLLKGNFKKRINTKKETKNLPKTSVENMCLCKLNHLTESEKCKNQLGTGGEGNQTRDLFSRNCLLNSVFWKPRNKPLNCFTSDGWLGLDLPDWMEVIEHRYEHIKA